jgi:hypothetical protein
MPVTTTDARLAIWAVIDHWPELNPGGTSVFKRKLTHADDVGLLMNSINPGIGDMLAIEVLPVRTTPTWLVHRMQEASYMLTIQIAGVRLPTIEATVEKLIRGLYQAAPDSSAPAQTYIKVATGYHPHSYDVTWQKSAVGDGQIKTKCWLVQINLGLRFQVDPFGATP